MAILCPRCQASMPDGAQFCSACGFSFGGASPSPPITRADLAAPQRTVALEAHEALAAAQLVPSDVVVGRDPSATIVFDNPLVSGRHAKFSRARPSGILVEDLGSTNGTYVDGRRITREVVSLAQDVRVGAVVVPIFDPRIASLVVRVVRRPSTGVPFVIGSAPTADFVIEDPEVASRHVEMCRAPDGTYSVRDLGTSQGTYVDNPRNRIVDARVSPTSLLLLGRFPLPLPVIVRLSDELRAEERQLAEALRRAFAEKPQVDIGRGPGVDIVIDHPTVSTQHARLLRRPDGSLFVTDLGSTNGTFVEGRRVENPGAVATPGARIGIGAIQLVLGERGEVAVGRAKVRLDLAGVGLVVADRGTGKPRALLDRVSMSVLPGELVGMLGPSGAGKSTLLMSVLGLLRPTSGSVFLNGRPLFQQYEAFRTNVGYVPQDDIVHPQLTVGEALRYACKLRLPPMKSRDLDAAIDRTLKQVGLFDQRDLQIGSAEEKVLSGGQRRRVNLAVELVTDPALLILDEPTSGLSWTDAADVVETLRRLADDGRTIVLTIHQPDFQEYEKFDSVAILGRGGKLLFYGPPSPDSYSFFGAAPNKPREMFDHVEQLPPDEWRGRFEKSETHRRFVEERAPRNDTTEQAPLPKPRSRSTLRQFPVLVARSLTLTLRSRTALALLLVQAPLLGLLIGLTTSGAASFRAGLFGCNDTTDRVDRCAVEEGAATTNAATTNAATNTPTTHVNRPERLYACDASTVSDELLSRLPPPAPGSLPTAPPTDLWTLASRSERHLLREVRIREPRTGLLAVLMALFLPMIIAASNVLVGERTIYERERLAGLNIVPYVLARFLVLAALGAIVTTLHLCVALPLLGLHGPPIQYWLVGVMVTAAASAMGLALSAAVRHPVSALWGINFLVIPQLLFAGSITRLVGVTGMASWLTTTRYALEALVHIDLHARAELAPCQIDRYMANFPGFSEQLASPLLHAASGTGAITFVSLIATAMFLKLRDKRVG